MISKRNENTPMCSQQVYEEAGSDFHHVAYFRTRIGLRNALQEEISGCSDKEAVLITLNRPIIFAQPVAFDRGMFHTSYYYYYTHPVDFDRGMFLTNYWARVLWSSAAFNQNALNQNAMAKYVCTLHNLKQHYSAKEVM